jgi:hypothetical protein
MTNLTRASYEWASRPAEERFLSVRELGEHAASRRARSHESARTLGSFRVRNDGDQLLLDGNNGKALAFTNWSFGQFSRLMKAPASFLRELQTSTVANILNERVGQFASVNQKLLFTSPTDGGSTGSARAFTGPKYGRIWDDELADAVEYINSDGRWHIPLAAYNGILSKQSTTIYGGDSGSFIFLVDEARPIDVDGQTFFRGFYAWNSETGGATIGLCTFLYSMICQNRIIWGARDIQEKRIRHSSGAPERFAREARPMLAAVANSSDAPLVDAIRKAKDVRVASTDKGVEQWLKERGFAKADIVGAVKYAETGGVTGSRGDRRGLWDIVQGGTYLAQLEKSTPDRVRMERQFSNLLAPYMPAEQGLRIDVEEGVA